MNFSTISRYLKNFVREQLPELINMSDMMTTPDNP